jgi:hypothetical protein
MAQGISIHIGLNAIDVAQYGWRGVLMGCESDARDMKAIATSNGFEASLLLTTAATSAAVIQRIRDASRRLSSGDILCVTYSGHGSTVADTNGDESDGKDETWLLYDQQLIDDQLWSLWSTFAAGVRILVISDSCHSGTVFQMPFQPAMMSTRGFLVPPALRRFEPRRPPSAIQSQYVERHRDLLAAIQRANPPVNQAGIGATVLLLAACQDDQLAADGETNGLFTDSLKRVWASGSFTNYDSFFQEIAARVRIKNPFQDPSIRVDGRQSSFRQQRPFAI